ncbi:hypothetical protein Goari_005550 [Gossypium aridum]|uniref:Uncharacterized protein n=1 Tax=Gossypium aridum TaxID=34290 RepID=A0A7J8YL73_GOSAI|nr:hypothetical protein [Gossypium aridum]
MVRISCAIRERSGGGSHQEVPEFCGRIQ